MWKLGHLSFNKTFNKPRNLNTKHKFKDLLVDVVQLEKLPARLSTVGTWRSIPVFAEVVKVKQVNANVS
jgi:hypothetical protein